MRSFLYHLTDRKHLGLIMQTGLIPQIGEAKINGEQIPCVHLTDGKHINYWRILTGKEVLLKIDPAGIEDAVPVDYAEFHFGLKEYMTRKMIEPEYIVAMERIGTNEAVMKAVCEEYLYHISWLCTELKEQNTGKWDIEALITYHLDILKRLDFSVLKKEEILGALEALRDAGTCTFIDRCEEDGKPQWALLDTYSDNSLTGVRKQLKDWVVDTFDKDILEAGVVLNYF